jgi:hypothetical protein
MVSEQLYKLVCCVCVPNKEEVTGEWTKLHIEELYDLYPLLNVIGMVISGRMRWARHIAGMGGGDVY